MSPDGVTQTHIPERSELQWAWPCQAMVVARGPSLTWPGLEALHPNHLSPAVSGAQRVTERDQPAVHPGLLHPCIRAARDTAWSTGCIPTTVPNLSVILELGPSRSFCKLSHHSSWSTASDHLVCTRSAGPAVLHPLLHFLCHETGHLIGGDESSHANKSGTLSTLRLTLQ